MCTLEDELVRLQAVKEAAADGLTWFESAGLFAAEDADYLAACETLRAALAAVDSERE